MSWWMSRRVVDHWSMSTVAGRCAVMQQLGSDQLARIERLTTNSRGDSGSYLVSNRSLELKGAIWWRGSLSAYRYGWEGLGSMV